MPALTIDARPRYRPRYRKRPEEAPPGYAGYELDKRETVFVRRRVLDTILKGTHSAAPSEAIGFLAGRCFEDDAGTWTLVEDAMVCSKAQRTKTYVETSDADHVEFDAWSASEALPWDRLGWWHSHYELRVPRYSGVDHRNQALWCPLAWQVGLLVLVDHGEARVRCYRGPDSQLCAGDGVALASMPVAVLTADSPLRLPPMRGPAALLRLDWARTRQRHRRRTRAARHRLRRYAWAVCVGWSAAQQSLTSQRPMVSPRPPQQVFPQLECKAQGHDQH